MATMIFSWIYVLLNALSAILRQIGGNIVAPSLILLIGSFFAILYFHAVNLHKVKFVYQRCWFQKRNWLILNIYVTVMWLSAVYAPSMIGGPLYIFIFFSILGIFGSLSLFFRDAKQSASQVISLLGLVGLLIFVLYDNIILSFTVREVLGISYAVIGGVSIYFYSKQSAAFMKSTQLSATQVLAIRFYLTIFVCTFLAPKQPFATLNFSNLLLVLAIALFCLIVPLYFVQKGIEKAGPEMNAIITSTTPFATAALEKLYYPTSPQKYFSIYILYGLFAAFPFALRRIKRWLDHRRQQFV